GSAAVMVRTMRTRTLALLVAAMLVGTVACSSDSKGGATQASDSQDSFCSLLLAFRSSSDALDTDFQSGDPSRAQSSLKRTIGQVKVLQSRAPADVKTDLDTVGQFLDQVDTLLGRFNYDLTKLQADPNAVDQFSALNSDDVSTSLDQLRTYGDTKCGETDVTS